MLVKEQELLIKRVENLGSKNSELYERLNSKSNEVEQLKEEVEGWKAADKRSIIYLLFFGVFFFLPIGIIIGRFFWTN